MDLWYGLKVNVKKSNSGICNKRGDQLFFGNPNTLMPKLQKQDEKISLIKIDKLEGFLKQIIINNKNLVTNALLSSLIDTNVNPR
jgi:hypothetical protein